MFFTSISLVKKSIGLVLLFAVMFLLNNCAAVLFNHEPLNVYESNHFTFFYRPGSIVEKELKSIILYSELSVKWFTSYTKIPVTVKSDVYLFDKGTGGNYNRLVSGADESMLDSNSTKGVITFYYKENNYIEAAVTILHETIHVIQDYILKMKNIGIAEGHASYLSLKYYFYVADRGYSDEFIFSILRAYVRDDIRKGKNMPGDLFSMTLPEFNGFNVSSDGIMRNPESNYEIAESFIVFINMTYGMEKLNTWLNGVTVSNYRENYKRVFGNDFSSDEKLWLSEIYSAESD